MSQPNVERVIGQLVTDEAWRSRFQRNPRAALQMIVERGFDLTPIELQALEDIDPGLLSKFSDAIDPCLQRIDPQGGKI